MASNDDYLKLRRLTGETQDKSTYSDADLDLFLAEAASDMNLAAAAIWREKAAAYADLVDISEAGSSRKEGDLYNRALGQAAFFEAAAAGTTTAVEGASTTRAIVRG